MKTLIWLLLSCGVATAQPGPIPPSVLLSLPNTWGPPQVFNSAITTPTLNTNDIYLTLEGGLPPWVWYIGQNAGWLSGIDQANAPLYGDFVPVFKCAALNLAGTACTGPGIDFMYAANNQDGLATVSPTGGATGTGYSLPCTVTLDDTGGQPTGDTITRAQVTVTSVGGTGGSQITGVAVAALGKYIVRPSTPTNQLSSTCGGTGATFSTTWKFNHPTIQIGEGSQPSQAQVIQVVVDPTNPGQSALQLYENGNNGTPFEITGSVYNETPVLGSEFLSNDANWTSTGWTGSYEAGWTAGGNTSVLSYSTAPTVPGKYIVQTVVTGTYGTGTVVLSFGGQSENLTALGTVNWGVETSTTGNLTITPPATFTGTIVVTIFPITQAVKPAMLLSSHVGASEFAIVGSSALYNTFLGGFTNGSWNVTGTANTGLGSAVLGNNISGNNNTGAGYSVLGTNVSGNNNTGFGASVLNSVTTSNNTGFGYSVFNNTTTGVNNTGVGSYVAQGNSTGSRNSYFGEQVGASNTTNGDNSGFGYQSLYYSTGYSNSAFGSYALYNSGAGDQNSAFGYQALENTTNNNNSAFGNQALLDNTSGTNNNAFGYYALLNLVGAHSNNVAVGGSSGRYYGGTTGTLTAIDNSTFLGVGASAANATGDTNETVIGYGATGNGSNTTTIGNTSVTSTVIPSGSLTVSSGTLISGVIATATGNYICGSAGAALTLEAAACPASDARVKHDIEPIRDLLLPFRLLAHRGVRFVYNEGKGAPGPHIGTIAQDWQGDFPELVTKDDDGTLHFDYQSAFGVTLAALQAQTVLMILLGLWCAGITVVLVRWRRRRR